MESTATAYLFGILLLISANIPPLIYYLFMSTTPNNKIEQKKSNFQPAITVFLPVKNEALIIEEKIREILSMEYDKNKLAILIIDSKSTDGTLEISKSFLSKNSKGVIWKVLQMKETGKTKAVNLAIDHINTEFFLMMDADAILSQTCLKDIMSHFQDSEIGAICGQKQYKNDDFDFGYRKAFNRLRIGESYVSSTPIFEGSICAFRKEAIGEERLNESINADDSQLAIIVKKNGYYARMKEDIQFTESLISLRSHKERSLRRSQGLIRTLWHYKNVGLKSKSYGMIYFYNFYFYLILPWLVTTSGIILVTIIFIQLFNNGIFEYSPIVINTIVLIIIANFSKFIKTYIRGIKTLIKAQFYLLIGKKLNIWDTDKKIRENIKGLRER